MTLPAEAGRLLLPLARQAIGERWGRSFDQRLSAQWLADPGASFVTLTDADRLRGCIGSLRAYRTLGADVQANAYAAAFADSRFAALSEPEFERIRIEVSVLGVAEQLDASSRAAACRQLRPGIDGVIVASHDRRATFLPQVWQQLPDPDAFIDALLRKAGLPTDSWDASIELFSYRVQAWQEPAVSRRESTG